MADAYVGEIRLFAGNFAPQHWAFCEGQLLSIQDYTLLFSLLGTLYGGDGRTNFGLPDCRGRVPVHQGTGPGLEPKSLGQMYGSETVTLTTAQIPAHSHTFMTSKSAPDQTSAQGMIVGQEKHYVDSNQAIATGPLADSALSKTGRGQPHENMMPTLFMNFIICLEGAYPARS